MEVSFLLASLVSRMTGRTWPIEVCANLKHNNNQCWISLITELSAFGYCVVLIKLNGVCCVKMSSPIICVFELANFVHQ